MTIVKSTENNYCIILNPTELDLLNRDVAGTPFRGIENIETLLKHFIEVHIEYCKMRYE